MAEMTPELTPADEAAIRARHRPCTPPLEDECVTCEDDYPCDAIRLLDQLAAQRERVSELTEQVRLLDEALAGQEIHAARQARAARSGEGEG